VGKRTRRERKVHQGEQAVAKGDIAALRALVEKGTHAAVPALVRGLGALPSDPAQAAEFDALALRVARQLRQAGEPEHALTLAAAGRRRTPAWSMEEALDAFALGRDELAADVAAGDATVAAALGPLLQAVRGEVAPASPAAPTLRALHASARAVAHFVRGDPDKAKAILRRVPVAGRAAAFTTEIALAAEPIPQARILRARMLAASSPGAVAEVVRAMGPNGFDAPDQASATLYHGFSLLRADPTTASRSFDRAVHLGADLIEALRGKMLATLAVAMSFPEMAPHADRTMRDAAAATDRLAHALERVPLGGPLAAAAGARAARHWLDAEDWRRSLAAIARARPLAGGALLDELALLEADATGCRSTIEAERLVSALLARSPGYVAAWKLKSNLVRAQGDEERAETILVEAAAATKDPELQDVARAIQGSRGELVPFEGLLPGAVSAGVLASELARVTTADNDAYPLAAAHREALGSADRLAFDGAAIAIAAAFGAKGLAERRLTEVVLAWRRAPRELSRLIGVALHMGLGSAVLVAALALNDDIPALRSILNALAVAGEGKLVIRILQSLAASLTRSELSFFKAYTEGRRPATIAGVLDPEAAMRELDRALAPEFSFTDFEHPPAGRRPPPGLARATPPTPGTGEILTSFLEMLDLPPVEVASIPPNTLRKVEQKMLDLTRGPQTPARMIELMNLLNEVGISPLGGFAPRPRKKR